MRLRDVWNWSSTLNFTRSRRKKSLQFSWIALVGFFAFFGSSPFANAKEWGLVVGVNDYAHFPPFSLPPPPHFDLQGAVNDANLIAEAMHNTGVDLPSSRILLNEDATLANFLRAWKEMTQKATANDTLIVTFAGHGAREVEVAAPFDEPVDGKDETIMFHDFDPNNPRVGRLNDDQLADMLAEASQFKIIWVMDSCHSAGLDRNVVLPDIPVITRNGGTWDIPLTPLTGEIQSEVGDDDGKLAHVTHILATSSEDKQVGEIVINGQNHGALSVFFARALQGAGDVNDDGIVTRGELSSYLQDRVFSQTNQQQQPRLLPRGDAEPIWNRNAPVAAPLPRENIPDSDPSPQISAQNATQKIRVLFDGTPPEMDFAGFDVVAHSPDLIFKPAGDIWRIFNHTGDEIRSLQAQSLDALKAEISAQTDRVRLLRALRDAKNDRIPAIAISSGHQNQTLPVGSIVSFTFHAPRSDMPFLTLFNVASSGIVQNLYPTQPKDDGLAPENGFLVKFKVSPPTGTDQLVATFCTRPPLDLRAALSEFNGKQLSTPTILTEILSRTSCQVNIVGLFTSQP